MILLDTDIASALIKGNRQVFDLVTQLTDEEWGIGVQVAFELSKGNYLKPDHKYVALVESFLSNVQIFAFDVAAANAAAALSATLQKSGKPIGEIDSQIAGQALSMNAVLVSNNTKHFKRVPGLRLTNWL